MLRALTAMLLLATWLLLDSRAVAAPADDRGIRFGTDEPIVSQVELPDEVQRQLALETRLSPWSAGFAYRRAFIFHEVFSLWHWHGRHLLHCGDNVIELDRAQLHKFVGPSAARRLTIPWIYRLPPGLIFLLGGVFALWLWFWISPSNFAQVERLLRDERYCQAADVYQASLPPPEEETTIDHRRQALWMATNYLVEKGIPRSQAEVNLRKVVSLREELRSKELRAQAVLHEQAGEWDDALDSYEEAAELRELWDAKDRDYLRKCIARVEQKQAREKA